MKIRMIYPFFNIISCIILLFMGWGFITNEPIFEENYFEYNIHPVGIIAWVVLVAFIIIFLAYVRRYNKQNPHRQVKTFSIKPPEYIEEDEMYQYATMKATKKVYTFLTWALPTILALLILPIPVTEYAIFVIVTCIIIIQNLIYFNEMRKFKES